MAGPTLAAAGLLCFVALALLDEAHAASCGGFAASCTKFYISKAGYFQANCRNNAGKTKTVSIDLNNYLGNNNGNLVPGAGVANSCTIIQGGFTGTTIYASCKRKDGKSMGTSYDINKNVANYNGNLKFNNCRRRALLSTGPALGGRKVLST